MRVIRDTGGVVGLMTYASYVKRGGNPTLDDYIAHIDHAVSVIGIDPGLRTGCKCVADREIVCRSSIRLCRVHRVWGMRRIG